MINTIIIINDFGFINGGIGKVAISSSRSLAEKGYHIIYFCAVKPIDKLLIHPNIKIICTGQYDILNDPIRLRATFQGLWNIKARKEFKNILDTLSPETTIIHYHGWIKALSPSIFSIKKLHNFKIYITLHDFFIYCPNGGLYIYPKNKICKFKAMSFQCILCNCDSRNYIQKIWRTIRQSIQSHLFKKLPHITYISISDLTEKMFLTNFPFKYKKLIRINNPIDQPLITNTDNSNKDLYLFMARLSTEKGIDLFCQSIRESNVKGCVIGDGYLLDEFKNKYPEIIFTGWLNNEEKIPYLKRTKYLVFPSIWYETFGLVVAEMLSNGIPCITSDTCAAKELIKENKTGFIFKNGSISSLKETIKKAENIDYKLMSNNIEEFFNKKEYSMDNHIHKLISTFNKN